MIVGFPGEIPRLFTWSPTWAEPPAPMAFAQSLPMQVTRPPPTLHRIPQEFTIEVAPVSAQETVQPLTAPDTGRTTRFAT